MPSALEDEFGDILQKARDGKNWSQDQLADAVGVSVDQVRRMERYETLPDDAALKDIAEALNLHAPSLMAIARESWAPQPPQPDPALDLICLDVFMGLYPVKCYLIRCKDTHESAVVDTGANPNEIIKKARELNLQPSKILLTHNHPDHAGGLNVLDREYGCPAWIGKNEARPSGSRDLRLLDGGETLTVGQLEVETLSTPGHTAGGISYRIHNTVLSGDCIFAGSMGRANASWSGLYASITKVLFALPDETLLHPGHGPATTVGEEKKHNPFFCGKV